MKIVQTVIAHSNLLINSNPTYAMTLVELITCAYLKICTDELLFVFKTSAWFAFLVVFRYLHSYLTFNVSARVLL